MRFVIHDSDSHKECGLERRVVDDVEHRSLRGGIGSHAQQHGNQAKMRDSGKGQ